MKIRINTFYLSLMSALVIFLPSLLMILFKQSSFTIGILISSLIVMLSRGLISKKRTVLDRRDLNLLLMFLGFFLFIVIHFTLVYYYFGVDLQPPEFSKFFLSFIFIIVCSIAAFIVKRVIDESSEFEVHSTLSLILYIVIFNAVVSLTKFDFFNTGLEKPTFLFLEPSHFALVCAPILTYFSFTNIKSPLRIGLLIMFGLWGVYIQNFTMILAVILAYIVTAKHLLPTFILIVLASIPAYLFIESDIFAYYHDRLDLSSDSSNLSAMVLLQGWDNAFLTLKTSIIGAGFQQYGISTPYGDISERIYTMLSIYINQFDGGSTAPKIVGEFGVFGILFIVLYIIGWFRVFFLARRKRFTADKKTLLYISLYLSSFLGFFIRGAGYFTPGMFFFVVSVIYFMSKKNLRKETLQ